MGVTKCSGILLHSIPRTPYRKSLWLKQINCKYLNSLNDIQLRSKRVCAKHFERKFYENDRLNWLIARPTLFNATEIAHGKPIYGQSDELYNKFKILDSLKDHTYHNVFFNSVDHPQTPFADSVFNTNFALQQIEEPCNSVKEPDEPPCKKIRNNDISPAYQEKTGLKLKRVNPKILTPKCKQLYRRLQQASHKTRNLKCAQRLQMSTYLHFISTFLVYL